MSRNMMLGRTGPDRQGRAAAGQARCYPSSGGVPCNTPPYNFFYIIGAPWT